MNKISKLASTLSKLMRQFEGNPKLAVDTFYFPEKLAKDAKNVEAYVYPRGCHAGGYVSAAILTREHNPKTEFIRAFAHRLEQMNSIVITPKIEMAIAITSTVVLNDEDLVITEHSTRLSFILVAPTLEKLVREF